MMNLTQKSSARKMATQKVKCVLVGDGAVGKTCMLIAYTENRFPVGYVPNIYDIFTIGVKVDGNHIDLSLWDTSAYVEYNRLSALSYPETDVFLLCFSVVCPASLDNIAKWFAEVERCCPEAKIILVGTKIDLRNDKKLNGEKLLTAEVIENVANKIRAKAYLECSAYTQEGLKNVFEEAVRTVINPAPGTGGSSKSSHASGSSHTKMERGCLIL
eukprot:TRINITY_DN846_c0_g3_i1.p1 TRINITY_DN846_c0_g3~~TRINITY_DN846_c0_g3_i1.p1  ORF type:complete len:215 (+),score=31.68 TRINITY_DN846_c0_g3_i1:52-696(+)